MSLIKWAPFFPDFNEMDKEFDDMLPAVRGNSLGYTPAIDMYEDANNITIEIQLVGIDSDQVDLSIESNILSIKGKSEKKSEIDEKNYYRKEIRQGAFFRSISLPVKVDGDKAEATSKGGILKIVIPKVKTEKNKSIKIKIKK